MSVPVGKRRISELEFFANAVQMRREITMCLLRNFGAKDRIRDLLLRSLILQITAANSIYPNSLREAEERRSIQNRAICTCECLLQELGYIATILPVDANKIERFVDMADREVALLKGWRKSDNKFFRRFLHPAGSK